VHHCRIFAVSTDLDDVSASRRLKQLRTRISSALRLDASLRVQGTGAGRYGAVKKEVIVNFHGVAGDTRFINESSLALNRRLAICTRDVTQQLDSVVHYFVKS